MNNKSEYTFVWFRSDFSMMWSHILQKCEISCMEKEDFCPACDIYEDHFTIQI